MLCHRSPRWRTFEDRGWRGDMTLGAGGGGGHDDTRSILHDAKITLCVMWRMGSRRETAANL